MCIRVGKVARKRRVINQVLPPVKNRRGKKAERNLQKRRFQEKDLWSILASCILGLSHLEKNNIKHSCLKSSSILLSYQGIIKISDPYTTASQSNYDVLLSNRSTPHIYLSPEQTQAL